MIILLRVDFLRPFRLELNLDLPSAQATSLSSTAQASTEQVSHKPHPYPVLLRPSLNRAGRSLSLNRAGKSHKPHPYPVQPKPQPSR